MNEKVLDSYSYSSKCVCNVRVQMSTNLWFVHSFITGLSSLNNNNKIIDIELMMRALITIIIHFNMMIYVVARCLAGGRALTPSRLAAPDQRTTVARTIVISSGFPPARRINKKINFML